MASKRVGSNEFGLKTGLGKKMSHYNQVRNWSGWVELYFSHEFFYLLKKKNMYLSLGMSCSKLLCVKYITLNSPSISRKSC